MTQDVETVSFGLDGQAYEVDACEEHRQQMHDAFATYVGAARKAGGSAGSGPRRASRGSGRPAASSGGGSDREEVQRIREWAREHGHKVSERGRLSSKVLEAYRAAQ
ncbi:MAG: Lsr2 family protein [Actinomycetota bacterium]|nr:Lsr2 family protein [Actinomycetota bacterium]